MSEFFRRLSWAFRCFFSILFKNSIASEILEFYRARSEGAGPVISQAKAETRAVAQPPPPTTGPAEGAVQMLALLQRDGRLVDFLREDISSYDDAQIGAAVRDVHASCRTTLDRYLALQPVMPDEEGRPVTVDAGFDPATIKVIGEVTGRPPYTGVLRHRGWRVAETHLPKLPDGEGRQIVAPAEVEIGG